MADTVDSFTETTKRGWGAKLRNAVSGLVIGPLMVVGAILLLTWNEGRSARMASALSEGERIVAPVSNTTVDPLFQGKLVYVQGVASTSETLVDDIFGVSSQALQLRRDVQMYQWKESEKSSTKKEMGGGESTTTEYRYSKEWSASLINSNDFRRPEGHTNPTMWRYHPDSLLAQNAHIGALALDPSLVFKIGGEQLLRIQDKAQLRPESMTADISAYDGGLYVGSDPSKPQIGDLRIKFYQVRPGNVSIVAGQQDGRLIPFVTSNGTELALVQAGVHSSAALFSAARTENRIMTWLVRLGGFVLATLGCMVFLSIFVALADVVPILGSIVGFGTGLISVVVGLIVSALTIAIAWFAYRPLAAAGLMVAAVVVSIVLIRRRRAAPSTLTPKARAA